MWYRILEAHIIKTNAQCLPVEIICNSASDILVSNHDSPTCVHCGVCWVFFFSFELHRLFTVVCGLSLVVAQRLSCPAVHGIKTLVQFLGWEDLLEKGKATHKGFSCGSAGKESPCNVGDLGLIPGLGRSPGEGKGYPLQYSVLQNSMDYIVHGVAKSQT